jgi:Tol biopolymer transport system component
MLSEAESRSVLPQKCSLIFLSTTGQEDFGRGDIYYSKLVNGEYTKPVNLGSTINSQGLDHCPYIAPDESYLIFSRMDNTGAGFYISFRNKDGQWQQPARLDGELEGVCPTVSPDGKYFFYSSDGIYWMDAKIIEELSPKE